MIIFNRGRANLKKISSKFLILIVFLSMVSMSFANETSDTYEVIEKYNLKIVNLDEIPSHIKPIVVENEKELVDLLKNIRNTKSTIGTNKKYMSHIMPHSYIYDDIHAYINYNLLWKHNLYATVKLTNTRNSIADVTCITTSAIGFTMGVDYKPDSAANTSRVSNDKKTATIKGGGTIDQYIVLEGIGTLFSEYDLITAKYEVGKGLVEVTHQKR